MKTPPICEHPRFKVDERHGGWLFHSACMWWNLHSMGTELREGCQAIQCMAWLRKARSEPRNSITEDLAMDNVDAWLSFDWTN